MRRGKIYDDITKTVGGTPLIYLNRMAAGLPARVAVKHEGFNPFSSVKDRIGVAMLEDAIERGVLKPGMTIVEPTSGNTGIGIAYAAAVLGYRCIFTMPDTMTTERRNMLRALGAQLELTEGAKGMKAAMARAEEIAAELGDRAWIPQQFANAANPGIHYRTTGPEIWEDTAGKVDVFVSGIGTGGTITGAGRFLREKKQDIRIVAVEPAESPVLSGGEPSPHKQQGIGADGPGFDDLPGIDNEILSKHRQAAGFAGLDQKGGLTAKKTFIGQHRKTACATGLIALGDACRIKITADDASRR